MKKFLAKAYIWFLLVILYAPIIFIIIFSFSESKVLGNWTGFSTNLYTNLFSPQAASATSVSYTHLHRISALCSLPASGCV